MKQSVLSPKQVLDGYAAVSPLTPHLPSVSAWRAWEYAAYRGRVLPEPVLDIGCGDGLFFRLVWPGVRQVVGFDADGAAVEAARRSGVYQAVHQALAHELPVAPESFASAFANCSLEHMDRLPLVLAAIRRSLRPGSPFLLSVVTDKFLEWASLPLLLESLGEPARAHALAEEYRRYHHLVNPLPSEAWVAELQAAGFEVVEHIPIVPEMSSRLFLFIDHLWHVDRGGRDIGTAVHSWLQSIPRFREAFGEVLSGVLRAERDWTVTSGAVFRVRAA